MPSSSRGSTWRRWDLHVHTPESLSHRYGGPDPWDRFLTELAELPPEMSVLGINDYIFVDGYRRVLDAFQSGRLTNLEAVFPVVELRLMEFAGLEGEFRRINYHVIFEEQFDPAIIEAQFINGLSAHYQLATDGAPWSGFPTRSNLADLGREIRQSMPEPRRREHQESDLKLGFANLVVNLENIVNTLRHSSLRGHAITAIGKAEWASLRWSDQSIAAKKHIINQADIVFTAAESPAGYDRAREKLVAEEVNDRLFDCSDAHAWSDSAEKDRIGNCWTWINAQPTLEGLRHALTEFNHRVFVGTLPKKLESVRLRPGDHIQRVALRPTASPATSAPLFDCSIDLNPGFVAVVGNKGKGKSALLDAIGLASDCTAEADFTFLSKDRFRNPLANRAAEYMVDVEWCDGVRLTRGMDDHVSALAPPRVTYLPQRLLDQICNDDPGEPSAKFARQLETVLFAHVPVADRLGAADLRTLIATRTSGIETQLAALRAELSSLNRSVVEVEVLLKPDRRQRVQEAKTQLEQRLANLMSAEPTVPPEPEGIDPILADEINSHQSEYSALQLEIEALEGEDAALATAIDAASQFVTEAETLQRQVRAFVGSNAQRAVLVEVNIDEVLRFDLNLKPINDAVTARTARRAEITRAISPDDAGSIAQRCDAAWAALHSAESRLDLPARLRAEAEAEHRAWAEACTELQDGSMDHQLGISGLDQELRVISDAPARLAAMHSQRDDLALRIHAGLEDKLAIYQQLYRPAREFIERHSVAAQSHLTFSATLREHNFEERFFDLISRGKSGTFMGLEDGAAQLRKRQETCDPTDPSSIVQFLGAVDDALHVDRRTSSVIPTDPEQCLRSGHDLEEVYDLLFGLSYLDPHYTLQYRNTDLDALSPGEKGTLLLMFYLLVDPGRCPLMLDQPDENLDNQTVKDLLVPALKEASARRQVIAVTHNPNVAIVADADQVIVATRGDSGFAYQGGAIEDGLINRDAVDVLEGTWSAFRNRQEKYLPPEGRSAV